MTSMSVLQQFYDENKIPEVARGVVPDMILRRPAGTPWPQPFVAVWDQPHHLDVPVTIEQVMALIKLGESAAASAAAGD